MRLLDLHPSVQAAISNRRISEGHGRALGGLSVEAQARARHGRRPGALGPSDRGARPPACTPKSTEAVGPADAAGDPELERVEEDLRKSLGTKVSLTRSRRGGRIVIEYYSDEELGRLYERLTGGTA